VSSPHDGDAHLGKKSSVRWIGYKVSLTETCEDDLPNLITHVETNPAPTADGADLARASERQMGHIGDGFGGR
jgi:hypothetical protein